MSWKKVKLKEVLKQYRVQHIVQDEIEYKQVTISKYDGVTFRGTKIGKDIGRKRQFVIDLKTYPNTLMLVRQGIQDGSIGIAPIEVDGCVATENMPMFSIEGIDLEYLRFLLKSPYFYDKLNKIETTGSAQKSIHERQILEIEIPLPDIEVQKEFVIELTKLKNGGSEISNELTHQLDLIKQLRQAFLREAMQGKLVKSINTKETGQQLLAKIKAEKAQLISEKKLKKEKELPPITEEEIPFEIPEHWAWCRLGELALHSEAGKSYQAEEIPAQKNQIGVIKTNAITTGFFLENKNKLLPNQFVNIDKIRIKKDDIIFCRASGSKGLAGKSCLVTQTPEAQLILSDKSIRFVFSVDTSKKYIQFYNTSFFAEEYYNKLGTGKSTSMNNITREQFNNLPIPLPPLYEQEQIVAKLEELMSFCDGLEQSIKESQGYNEMLLQQVLREALQEEEAIDL